MRLSDYIEFAICFESLGYTYGLIRLIEDLILRNGQYGRTPLRLPPYYQTTVPALEPVSEYCGIYLIKSSVAHKDLTP